MLMLSTSTSKHLSTSIFRASRVLRLVNLSQNAGIGIVTYPSLHPPLLGHLGFQPVRAFGGSSLSVYRSLWTGTGTKTKTRTRRTYISSSEFHSTQTIKSKSEFSQTTRYGPASQEPLSGLSRVYQRMWYRKDGTPRSKRRGVFYTFLTTLPLTILFLIASALEDFHTLAINLKGQLQLLQLDFEEYPTLSFSFSEDPHSESEDLSQSDANSDSDSGYTDTLAYYTELLAIVYTMIQERSNLQLPLFWSAINIERVRLAALTKHERKRRTAAAAAQGQGPVQVNAVVELEEINAKLDNVKRSLYVVMREACRETHRLLGKRIPMTLVNKNKNKNKNDEVGGVGDGVEAKKEEKEEKEEEDEEDVMMEKVVFVVLHSQMECLKVLSVVIEMFEDYDDDVDVRDADPDVEKEHEYEIVG